jgi:hypothetical protein
MPIIDTNKISPEVNEKYSVENNAFLMANIKNEELDRYDGKPKDEINVIVGDDKQPDNFLPQVKLCRWSNEVNFSVRLIDDEVGQESVNTIGDKIVWEKGNKKIEFYDYEEGEGGSKLVWYLKKKPKTNKVEFSIQSKNLDFFYQPPLTQEYQNGYSDEFQKEIVVTETQVKDLDGNVLAERHENVVGSYAVYHSTKGGMNDAYGKDYKTGQAFMIYRPHLIDANGLEAWGNLHIENGIYSVEIPEDFYNKAVYPIKSNDTFGYETAPATDNTWVYNTIRADYPYSPTSSGIISKLVVFSENGGSINDGYFRPVIYKNSDNTLIGYGPGVTMGDSQNWVDAVLDNGGTIVALTEYMLGGWLGPDEGLSMPSIAYNSATNIKARDAYTYHATNSPPNPCSWSAGKPNASLRWGIYATYTPSGGGGTPTLVAHNNLTLLGIT